MKKKRKLIFDEKALKLFALNLKSIRLKKKFTQQQLAFESGLSLSQIARIETAKINPTISTVFQIARTLEVSPKELFEFELE